MDDCSSNGRFAICLPSEYVDSFEVIESNCRKTRINYVRKQLEAIREILFRNDSYLDLKSVVLIISMAGIKMCSLDGKIVHMAHELKRVSYATCDPDFCLFAFVAREPNADHRNRQYCHVFKTDSPDQAEEINYIVGGAFRAAYSKKCRKDPEVVEPEHHAVEPRHQHMYSIESGDVPIVDAAILSNDEVLIDQQADFNQTTLADQLECVAATSTLDENNRKTYVQLEKIEPFNVSPVRMRLKNANSAEKVLPSSKSDEKQASTSQQQRKRRPLSAALMLLGKKEKRKNFSPSNNTVDISHDDSNNSAVWSSTSGSDERHLLETVSSTTELLKRNSTVSNGGGSLFKRLFGGSTWRMNSLQENSGDNVALNGEKLTNNTKKRRPLSAVFVGASLRNAVDKKRNSIFNLRSAEPSIASARPPSGSRHGGSLKEPVDRKARSVINLDSVARRTADSPARHSIIGPASYRCTQHNLGNGPRSSTDSIPPMKRDYLVPMTAEDEKKLQDAAWYVERPSKEMIIKVLTHEPLGSFIVRRSTSQHGCLALSVRVAFSHNHQGVSNFLILQTTRGFKLKGFSKDFPSVHALVTHHSIMPEQLPCRLIFVNRDADAFVNVCGDSHSSDGKRSVGTMMEKSDDDDENESIYGVTSSAIVQHSSPEHITACK